MVAGKHIFVAVAAFSVLVLGACSSDPTDETAASPSTSTTSTMVETTTTTTAPTTTALSEQDKAEAEIEQLVTEWYLEPYDSSQGQEGIRVEYLTGLARQRAIEYADEIESQGRIARSRGGQQIEVTGIEVDLEAGEGALDACIGSDVEFIDNETQEVVGTEDPTYLTTSEFLVVLTDDGWKVTEWYSSLLEDTPTECEIAAT